MSDVAIVTDSCACIPSTFIQELDITWIPYYIHRGEEVLRDLVTIKQPAFYSWLPAAQNLPQTASPGPGDYYTAYKELAEAGKTGILSVHMTSLGSGAFQAARAAASMIQESIPHIRIEVIDTLNVAMCTGWIVIEAAREALNRAPFEQLVTKVRALIPQAEMIQTADTLKYLYMGGRIGRATNLVGSLLNIKPIIGMKDGVIVALGKARSRRRAYEQMIELVLENLKPGEKIRAAFMHAAAPLEAAKLKRMLEEKVHIIESMICEFSPALGVHCGPGTAGICYLRLSE
ncbi:MAG: DegV family protein [Anaerolineales bacterium]|nr:DegV family protein [Anaerolineales bacterium]